MACAAVNLIRAILLGRRGQGGLPRLSPAVDEAGEMAGHAINGRSVIDLAGEPSVGGIRPDRSSDRESANERVGRRCPKRGLQRGVGRAQAEDDDPTAVRITILDGPRDSRPGSRVIGRLNSWSNSPSGLFSGVSCSGI